MPKTREAYYSELTRNLSFKEVLGVINKRQRAVFNMIDLYGPIYTEAIAVHLNVYPNYISPRIQELRWLGLIELDHIGKSSTSNKPVCFYRKKQAVPVQITFEFKKQ